MDDFIITPLCRDLCPCPLRNEIYIPLIPFDIDEGNTFVSSEELQVVLV